MMSKSSMFHFAILFTLTIGATAASAELQIERDVSIVDDAGGSLVMLTVAVRDDLGGESTTTATFNDFQPDPDNRRVSGEVVRERTRSAERVENRFNGALDIVKPSNGDQPERLNSLVFEGVTLLRDGEGPVLSGQVIYNGEARDVADLPRPALRVLSRLLRFFHFS